MTDYASTLINGLIWGVGFSVPFWVGLTWATLKILSHPSVRAIAKAAAKIGDSGGGIWSTIVKEGFGFLRGGGGG